MGTEWVAARNDEWHAWWRRERDQRSGRGKGTEILQRRIEGWVRVVPVSACLLVFVFGSSASGDRASCCVASVDPQGQGP